MRYPYHHEQRGKAIRFLPLLPFTLHEPTDSAEVDALVDSGAEESIFRSEVADALEQDYTSSTIRAGTFLKTMLGDSPTKKTNAEVKRPRRSKLSRQESDTGKSEAAQVDEFDAG